MVSRRRTALFVISVAVGIAASLATSFFLPKLTELSRQELIAEVGSGFVHEVVVTDGEVLTGVSTRRGKFRVVLRRGDNSLTDELTALGVEVKYETTPLGLI